MRALIISQDPAVTQRIQSVLERCSLDCRQDSGTDDRELENTLTATKPDLVIVVLPSATMSDERLAKLSSRIGGKLIVAGQPDPKRILHLQHHCGIHEYLDVEDLENEVEALLRRSSREGAGKVIAVLSPSGGGGSTTVSVNLAEAFVRRGIECALIDLNFSTGDTAALLNVKPNHSIADLARNTSRMDNLLFAQLLVHDRNGVALLAAPQTLEEIPDVDSAAVSTAVRLARSLFPVAVIDVDASFCSQQIEALEAADVILVVFQLDFCSLKNVGRMLEYFWRRGVEKSSVKLIANRCGQAQDLSRSQVESALRMKITAFLPEDRKDVNRAGNTGVPVVIGCPRAAISKQIEQLVTELNTTLLLAAPPRKGLNNGMGQIGRAFQYVFGYFGMG